MPLVHYQTCDLFGEGTAPASLLRQYEEAFENWLASAKRSGTLMQEASAQTYHDLWTVLAKWSVTQTPPVPLNELGEADLEAFIASRHGLASPGDDLSPRYVWRLLHLVDRVLAHHARSRGEAPNKAALTLLESRPAWRYANAARSDELPQCLPADVAKELVTFLSSARPRPGGASAPLTWQELRNRASVGLQLGAGLTPGDVRAALVTSPTSDGGRLEGVPWKIHVPADGVSPARETPLAPWAGQLLRHWLQVRAQASIAGPFLFPSTKTGKPWSKVAQYLASKQVLLAAGFSEEMASGGSFRMRHTFALRQLRRGRSADEVARWLGIVDPSVMARYLRVLSGPVDGVV